MKDEEVSLRDLRRKDQRERDELLLEEEENSLDSRVEGLPILYSMFDFYDAHK